jgi:hypothetical protein
MAPGRREFVQHSGSAAAAFAASRGVPADNGRARPLLVRSEKWQSRRLHVHARREVTI